MTTIDMTGELMTITDAATELTISERTVRRLVDSGKLRMISVTGEGGCLRVSRASVEEYKLQLVKEARHGIAS